MTKFESTRLFDPIQVEVWRHLLAAVAEEMGGTLERTAYSPNIKERLDHSCALFDANGLLLAQAAHIPVHLGAMPLMMQSLLHRVPWPDGVMWLCNDPRFGGTHLPDLTLVSAVYSGRRRLGFVASRAHHADIGGLSPGSLPLSREIFHEGIVLSPIRLVERGKVREDVLNLVCANSRTPQERRGDIAAQVAANQTGARRLRELVNSYGLPLFRARTAESIAYADAAVRRTLALLPQGVFEAIDLLDDDGAGTTDIPIRVSITLDGSGEIAFNFSGTAAQVAGSLNATEAITRSACYYVVRCLVSEEIPTNEGCFRPVHILAPEGTLVNAKYPAAVAAGNVETSQRIVDVLLRALSEVAPDQIPAASQGTMNNLTIGGFDAIRQRHFAYYETVAGGAGASPQGPGLSAVQSHMTNTRNTPTEALESHYPLRVREVAIAEETGGVGRHNGGNGIVRSLELLCDATVSLLSERRIHRPFGLQGGGGGGSGSQTVTLPGHVASSLPGKSSDLYPQGTVFTIHTPGGGGWGIPVPLKDP